jgi:hypothetical protein
MKNAHERFGVLEYTKRMKDTTTRIRLRLDRFIGEVENDRNCKAHLVSVLGGDADVGAIWAAVVGQNHFTVQAPGIDPLTMTLGEGAQCFRGTLSIAGREPIRHLVAISADLAKTRPGADPQGRRTILCDDDPTFVLHRVSQRFGLPVVPEWAGWFIEEITRHRVISPLVGLGCSPVLVKGTKKLFLKWIGRALRQKLIQFPESNGPVSWSLSRSFFQVSETDMELESGHEASKDISAIPAEVEDKQSCELH